MEQLNLEDRRSLEAAQGWVDLGNWKEAEQELKQISPAMHQHPEVLGTRCVICGKAKKWENAIELAKKLSEVLPNSSFGWLNWAFALHELKRTQEAWDVLLPVIERFPNQYVLRYNLACYACQLGNQKEAWNWLEKAIEIAGVKQIKQMALDDLDLKPLWGRVSKL